MNHTDLMHKIVELKAENKLLVVSLRDEFAMAGMNGLLWRGDPIVSYQTLAIMSYRIADAMLAEREKGQTDDR